MAMDEALYADVLARSYKKKGEQSNNWTDYLKAHGLANYGLAKDPTPSRRRLVYEIENSWYKGKHPLTYQQHVKLNKEHKQLLQNFRKNTNSAFQLLERQSQSLDMIDVFSTINMDRADKFASSTFKASTDCTEQFLAISKTFIESSIDLLQRSGKTPPCKFSVLGLGSAAKGEVTPYSDLEYAFIVEREDEYFEALAVDSYFRIGNMGETPLKCFDIQELKVEKGSPPVLSDSNTVGYRIDGITKKAGNIPTGNGREDGEKLTLTVDQLMELYRRSAESPFDGMAGDKSDMLSSTVVIYTNEGKYSRLHEEFLQKRKTFEAEVTMNQRVARKRLESFVQDVRSYIFLPEFLKFQPPQNSNVEVKVDVFRYPTLLANHIKLWLRFEENYSWKVYEKMMASGKLSKPVYQHLRVILAISLYMRTSTYLYNRSQTGVISLGLYAMTFQEKSRVPLDRLFVVLGCLLMPIKQQITLNVDKLNSLIRQNPDLPLNLSLTLTNLLKRLKSGTTNFLQQAEVLYFVELYPVAKEILQQMLPHPLESISCSRFIKVLKQTNSDSKFVRKYVELSCYLLYNTCDFPSAIDYLDWLISTQSSDNGLWLLLKARCARETQDFKTVGELLQQVDDLLKRTYPLASTSKSLPTIESAYGSDMTHIDAAQFLSDIGSTYTNLAKYQKAKCYLERSVSMFEALGAATSSMVRCYSRLGILDTDLGNYKNAMESFHKALELCRTLSGAEICAIEVAQIYGNMGNMCCHEREYDKALKHFFKSLHMSLSIYGPQSQKPFTSHCYNNIGNVYMYTGKFDDALKYFSESLAMRKAIHGADSNHPDIAASYNNIGNAYSGKKRYCDAQKHFEKSLKMKRVAYGADANHGEIANSLMNLGAVHEQLGNYDLALRYCNKATQMRKAVYGEDSKHPSISSSFYNLGQIHLSRGEHLTAKEYFAQATEMSSMSEGGPWMEPIDPTQCTQLGDSSFDAKEWQLALKYYMLSKRMLLVEHGGDSRQSEVVDVCLKIGKTCYSLGNYQTALEHYLTAMET